MDDDLFAPEVVHDPYTYFGRLREEDPVHWNTRDEAWLITRYEDVVWLTRHPELFSSAVFTPGATVSAQGLKALPSRGASADVQQVFLDMFIRRDRPTHTAMRQVVHGMFTPQAMERWRPLVRSVIHALLDEVEVQGGMEILHEFAMPMTMSVIVQLLGLPHRERDVQRALSEALLTLSRWRRAPGERDRIAESVRSRRCRSPGRQEAGGACPSVVGSSGRPCAWLPHTGIEPTCRSARLMPDVRPVACICNDKTSHEHARSEGTR